MPRRGGGGGVVNSKVRGIGSKNTLQVFLQAPPKKAHLVQELRRHQSALGFVCVARNTVVVVLLSVSVV